MENKHCERRGCLSRQYIRPCLQLLLLKVQLAVVYLISIVHNNYDKDTWFYGLNVFIYIATFSLSCTGPYKH